MNSTETLPTHSRAFIVCNYLLLVLLASLLTYLLTVLDSSILRLSLVFSFAFMGYQVYRQETKRYFLIPVFAGLAFAFIGIACILNQEWWPGDLPELLGLLGLALPASGLAIWLGRM